MFASRQAICRAVRPNALRNRLCRYSTESAASPPAGPDTIRPVPSASSTSSTASKYRTSTPAPAARVATTYSASPASKPVARPAYTTSAPKSSLGWQTAPSPEANSLQEANKDIDWTESFHGASTQPVSKEQYEILTRAVDVDDIEVKPDGIIYLPEIKYRRRLNEAFGPMGWSLIPRGEAAVGESIVTREYALLVGGRFASQAQGENNYFGADQLPSAVEGCKSNALMRTCKDLGIASELWDPTFILSFKKNYMQEVWVEHQTTKKKRTFWYRKGRVEVAYPYKQATTTMSSASTIKK